MLDLQLEKKACEFRTDLLGKSSLDSLTISFYELKEKIMELYPDIVEILEDLPDSKSMQWSVTKNEGDKFSFHLPKFNEEKKKISLICCLYEMDNFFKKGTKSSDALYFARAFFMPRLMLYEAIIKNALSTYDKPEGQNALANIFLLPTQEVKYRLRNLGY